TELMEESVIYQDILQKGEARGEARGKVEGKVEIARNLLNLGMALAQIAEVTGLTVEQVSQLESE
ncbi:MAG: flagellar assembly protein H, partial [Spirulinaceae cyanobacterium]